MVRRYRIHKDTSVVVTKNRKTRLITISEGSIITVRETRSIGNGLVSVEWDHKTVKMFAADLERRAELIQEAAG